MTRNKLNCLVDIISFVVFAFCGLSGWALNQLPRGWQGSRGEVSYLLGINRTVWNKIHNVSGYLIIALVLIHLLLHWNYIKNIKRLLTYKAKND